jgi:NDP-sugar pyrophosphorylase family protein
MDTVSILPDENIGNHFLPAIYIPEGQDEYSIRNSQLNRPADTWRKLRAGEIERLVKNGNTADKWENILVTNLFEPDQILNTEFSGFVRIGRMQNVVLEHHDLRLPSGITNSRIVACDIGDDVAIHNVHYLAHYIIGNRCILKNIDEMHTTNHAKFGNGILKDGEDEKVRVWLDVMNETGSRKILPFDRMIPADAYLWAKYRDDEPLQRNLKAITQAGFDTRRGYYGMVGDQSVIKSCRIIKDVIIGSHCYIKGANKLKNLTVNSDADEPTQVGEGVELVNGIIGFGCHIFYGCKAVRFILADHSNLKYGARLINSFLGENSTISCCEVLNNLIFPGHEQHHNNSFLIASVVMGQSNMAAGVTAGSNHNSRANDNEIQAGRGFWPGLCASIKHSCRFASFVLLSKADYPCELDIPLPFSLLNNNTSKDELEVLPAFWWLYNMYALARNTWKFHHRDTRQKTLQKIEFDALAPDTVEEILHARYLLERWTGMAHLRNEGASSQDHSDASLARLGRDLLARPESLRGLEVVGENMEKSSRKVVIVKPYESYHAYYDMLLYYAVKNLMAAMPAEQFSLAALADAVKGPCSRQWVNLGGQLIPEQDVEQLRKDIGEGSLTSWEAIHNRYAQLWDAYPLQKQKHAWQTLCLLYETDRLTNDQWQAALEKAASIQDFICEQVYISRKKDYDNPFRQATYRNPEEMTAAIGTIEDNDFVKQVREETRQFKESIEAIKLKN